MMEGRLTWTVRARSSSFRSTFRAACLPKTLIDKTKYLRAVLAALNKLSPNRLDTDLGYNLSLIFNLETSTPGTFRIKVRRKALGSHVIQPRSSLVWNVIYLFAPPNRRQDSPSPCVSAARLGDGAKRWMNKKNPPLNRPSKYKPPGGGACTWKSPSNTK